MVAAKETVIELDPVQTMHMELKIVGTSPLLMHKFSDSAKADMVSKQIGVTREKKKRDIKTEMEEAIHRLPDGTVGFPASGFKKAMVETAPYLKSMNKKLAKGSFFIMAESNLVPIEYKEQVQNEATVKLATGVSMVRYRPEFREWVCVLKIMYNANQLSPQQIINMANVAGFHIGVGEWTPQHDGSYGMFTVATNGNENNGNTKNV